MKETVAFILCDEHKRSIGNFRGKKAQAKGKNTFLLSATTVWVLVCVTDIVVSQPLVKTWRRRQQAKKKSSQLVLCYLPLLILITPQFKHLFLWRPTKKLKKQTQSHSAAPKIFWHIQCVIISIQQRQCEKGLESFQPQFYSILSWLRRKEDQDENYSWSF